MLTISAKDVSQISPTFIAQPYFACEEIIQKLVLTLNVHHLNIPLQSCTV